MPDVWPTQSLMHTSPVSRHVLGGSVRNNGYKYVIIITLHKRAYVILLKHSELCFIYILFILFHLPEVEMIIHELKIRLRIADESLYENTGLAQVFTAIWKYAPEWNG